MSEKQRLKEFTVYLEGHDGHQGNVLGHAYVKKLSKLLTVLAKLERTYLNNNLRQTDFEIVNADKYNPTTITFRPVPREKNYSPIDAFNWSLDQIEKVGKGLDPDERIKSAIARDLAELSKTDTDQSFKRFWINGKADLIKFNDDYHVNATTLASKLAKAECPTTWHSGVSYGEVVGRLEKIDNLDADHEFYIVPPVGPEKIRCKFPSEMEDEVGPYIFHMVRVRGDLYYTEQSPHPIKIILKAGGISPVKARQDHGSLRDLRGLFKGTTRREINLDALISG